MLKESLEVVSDNPNILGILLIALFLVTALIFGIPAILSRSLSKVILVLSFTIFATIGTYLFMF
ncbi:hypothetical protein AWH56_009110 [Anaerobacillus isosaccharinicus]|uniref:Uncharacterized protein n=1 Tax=Anaerobacillus isosaccharinicus TaxID=1532552 RepID=A0A1S2M5M6_9BACI|nr:hypothetical protein [Anaerobacillus isosaccharinicus]QOY37721.1 hypothetical protein AWH56_009110 [Anaerobacillus isosaccharinicus]